MPDDKNKEDLLKLLQQNNQNLEASSLEDILKLLILNPLRLSTSKTQLNSLCNGIISETKEGTILNKQGFVEDIKEVSMGVFDDGTSLSGVTKCQTCGGIVKDENLRRCECGKTCCVRRGCGKYSSSGDEWYCSKWHLFLGSLGFKVRW